MCLMVKSKFSLWNTHSASPVLALLHCILYCLAQTITARPGLNGAIVWPVVTPQCPGWLLWSPAQLSVGHYYKYWATLGGEVSVPRSFIVVHRSYRLDWVLELETKVMQMIPKISQSRRMPLLRSYGTGRLVSIVSYSRPSLTIIVLRTQFHVERPWGQRPFSIVS